MVGNFGFQISEHQAAHGSPDHQPGAHSPLCQLPGDFDADESLSSGNAPLQFPLSKGSQSAHAPIDVKNLTGQPGTGIRE
jgi:hypothetical protein